MKALWLLVLAVPCAACSDAGSGGEAARLSDDYGLTVERITFDHDSATALVTVENRSRRDAGTVALKCRFEDADGVFIDEGSGLVNTLPSGGKGPTT